MSSYFAFIEARVSPPKELVFIGKQTKKEMKHIDYQTEHEDVYLTSESRVAMKHIVDKEWCGVYLYKMKTIHHRLILH